MRLLQLVRSHLLSIVVALLALGAWPTSAAAQPPTPEPACNTVIAIDTPSPGASVSGSLLVKGWALDIARQDGSGVNQVHVYLDGEAGTGTLLGGATLGQFRPDVDAVAGRSSSQAGWSFAWNLAVIPAGSNVLYVYAQDACGWTFVTRPVVVSPTVITIDRPAIEATVGEGQPIVVDGWTLDPRAPSGSGIDAVHVYLDGEAGAAGIGVAAVGRPRPDVAAALGRPTAGNTGFSLDTRLPGVLP
ncbi:MAG: conserved repeat protein, partial [Chloroflexi bacterium]|nr:conserved repeat protein [Chloroflexota bacterium]